MGSLKPTAEAIWTLDGVKFFAIRPFIEEVTDDFDLLEGGF